MSTTTHHALVSQVDWKKGDGLIPAIIQDSKNNTVLMLGFMNKESLERTLKTGKVWFYSRTKERLWMKGETSRNVLRFVEGKLDCDSDTLLIKVAPEGPTCHTGMATCFNEENEPNVLKELFDVIEGRRVSMPEGSYTATLFSQGVEKICAKVEEESDEVIHAAKEETHERLIEESVDLIYHLMVLLAAKRVSLDEVLKEIKKRRK